MTSSPASEPDQKLPVVYRLLMGWCGVLAVVGAALPFLAWTAAVRALAEEVLAVWVALEGAWLWTCHRAALRRTGQEHGVGAKQAAVFAMLSTLLLPIWSALATGLLLSSLARHCANVRTELAPRFAQLAKQARSLLGFGFVWSLVALWLLRSAWEWSQIRSGSGATPFHFQRLHGWPYAVALSLVLVTWPMMELWWLARGGPALWRGLESIAEAQRRSKALA